MYPDRGDSIWTAELHSLLGYLRDSETQGILLIGSGGIGKTTLLRMAEVELRREHRDVFFVPLANLVDPGELGSRILAEVATSSPTDVEATARTVQTSAGAPSLREIRAILRRLGARMSSPVLLLDGLDETVSPGRVASVVEELSFALGDWKLVVSSRRAAVAEFSRFSRFAVLQLQGFTPADASSLLRRNASELTEQAILYITESARGNPLLLRLLARSFERTGVLLPETTGVDPTTVVERVIERSLANLPETEKLTEVLEELALAGGREQVAVLANRLRVEEGELRRRINLLIPYSLVVLDDTAATAHLFHQTIRDQILSRRFLDQRFSLEELKFGAEEAERDELLEESFVRRRDLGRSFNHDRSIIIGDRGSGKSAIFRRLATGTPLGGGQERVEIFPVANTSDLLHRIVSEDAWTDANALSAAWLVVIAGVVGSAIPTSAPKGLRRNASDLRTALGLATAPESRLRRALRACVRPFGGTTLKFAVGPVGLEAQFPSGSSRSNETSVDVEAFLHAFDSLLKESSQRVVVMFDRIDETFKYDRVKQEAVVQGLLQAENRISQLGKVGLLLLLRTDLFELYDIQEKNKLVSRTVTLDWSDEDWLQVLIRRVFANLPLHRIAARLRNAEGGFAMRSALEVLFPPEMEGRPIDRWLTDSLRNGNGDVSPRLAVLLLHLVREHSAHPEAPVLTLPLFSAEAISKAMTKLSDLSFSEVVNDFKVAPTFVLNCRAGKLESFTLDEVRNLFDENDGKIGDQVRILERLGFLERVVRIGNSGTESLFQIPKLYTRCWNQT